MLIIYYLLFSPAATSFNMFVNEFERAKKFNELIKWEKKIINY